MSNLYNTSPPKYPTNLTINDELLEQAKSLHITVSSTLEAALAEKVRQCRRDEWIAENRKAMDAYNGFIEKEGLFSDELRIF